MELPAAADQSPFMNEVPTLTQSPKGSGAVAGAKSQTSARPAGSEELVSITESERQTTPS
jgi:hypothetical protein